MIGVHPGEAARSEPLVIAVRRNALDDGPGIRTTVFLKGCPLECRWCQNPEAIRREAELAHAPDACLACGECARACPRGAIRSRRAGGTTVDRAVCEACGRCAGVCPSGALKIVGRRREAESLAAEVLRDAPFFRASGGGVTLSGGEPAMHLDWSGRLLRKVREAGVHTAIQTCGHFDLAGFVARILPWTDEIQYDLKLADPAEHERYTGRTNELILANLAALARLAPLRLRVRIPLIPGITATRSNLLALGRALRMAGVRDATLLPYNPTWLRKAAMVGRMTSFRCDRWMTEAEVREARELVGRELAGRELHLPPP